MWVRMTVAVNGNVRGGLILQRQGQSMNPRSCNQVSARQRSVAIYNDDVCISMPQPDRHSIKVAVMLPKNHIPGTRLRDRLHRQHNLLSQWLSVGQTNLNSFPGHRGPVDVPCLTPLSI